MTTTTTAAAAYCEPLTVDKGTLSIVTKIHDTSHAVVTFVPVNGIVHDTAHVTGANSDFPADLTKVGFVFYNTIDCTGDGSLAANTGFDEVTTSDLRSADVGPLASGAYSFRAGFAGDDNYNAVPGSTWLVSRCRYGRSARRWATGATGTARPGFRRLRVHAGQNSASTCYIAVNKAKTATIFPNTKNGVSILTNCTTVASRDAGINTESLNVAARAGVGAEAEHRPVSGFNGQPIGALGVTLPTVFPAGWSLTATSTVQQALDYANYLIAQSKAGTACVITQTMIGQLNTHARSDQRGGVTETIQSNIKQ